MSDKVLRKIQSIIQRDVNNRGLAKDPKHNLLTACKDDFVRACQKLFKLNDVSIVTGFYIPTARAAETDGPLGAVLLARCLARLGKYVQLVTDDFGMPAIRIAFEIVRTPQGGADHIAPNKSRRFPHLVIPHHPIKLRSFDAAEFTTTSCLIAIERAGPSHTLTSLQKQSRRGAAPVGEFLAQCPRGDWDQYHTMRGHIITDKMSPAHHAFDVSDENGRSYWTIGVGDGGNEIGMGKIPWETIAKNIPNGGLVACRVATDYNIVCGVSNWGAYGLAAGVWHLSRLPLDKDRFSADRERELWEKVLKEAVLVDGVTGQRTLTVDGLSWDDYIEPLREIAAILKESS
jgi:hypothetical protein